MFNVTSEVIADTIDRNYSGDVLAFITDFIDYCNAYTTFGTPTKHSPFDEVRHECDAVLCMTCDELLDMSEGVEPALVELRDEVEEDSFTVYATRYYRDNDTDELISDYWAPRFIVTRPEQLSSLCEYVGVNFEFDFFEE